MSEEEVEYWKDNFKQLYEFTKRVFGILMKDDDGINPVNVVGILYSKWYRSDPWCKGVWAREKMKEIEGKEKETHIRVQLSPEVIQKMADGQWHYLELSYIESLVSYLSGAWIDGEPQKFTPDGAIGIGPK